jgi:Zn-dependent metalloprotease
VGILKQWLCLALFGAGLVALPGLQAGASGQLAAAPDRPLVQQMRSDADGAVRITRESATGKVGFVAATGAETDLLPAIHGDTTAKAVKKATTYLDRFGAAFGAGKGQLKQTAVRQGRYGWTVTYAQEYRGVEVFGSMLRAHLDKSGDLTSVNGYAAPDLKLSVEPRLSAAGAGERAVRLVGADPARGEGGEPADTTDIEAKDPRLVVYRTGAIKGDPGEAVLAYTVEVTNERNIRDMVVIDAQTGKVVNRYSMMAHALERELYEAFIDDNETPENPDDDFVNFDLVWEEGQDTDGLNEAQLDLHHGTGEAYWLFKNAFNYDSYDGAGATMITVNNDPRIACPNANWNGFTTNYCDGVTSDDTVAHEWAHAYTEYTSGLIYQYQPGALNESYSDIWGETVDMLNDRFNETPNTVRAEGACSTHSPAIPLVTITAPESIAGKCLAGGSSWGDLPSPEGITGEVVVATDAAEPQDADPAGTTTDGCSPFDNAAEVAGKIAMVDRGRCFFFEKAQNARDAGALALIIGNNDDSPLSFSGDDEEPPLPYTIGIGLSNREKIRVALDADETVTIEIKDQPVSPENSYRWLSGEADDAFGGAIRDMWTPTCHGDPGKVSDAEYDCDPSQADNGGVHSNSGVPNHAFALLVDGGTYNDRTIAPIGLDKAAAIWWRSQSAYLTPVSDFTAAADALESSCTDLIGADINELTLDPEAAQVLADPITTADCTAVATAMAAVEMRSDPEQCDFQPMLDKNPPSVCGPGFTKNVVWKEDFEDGLTGWESEQVLADLPDFDEFGDYAGGFGAPWDAVNDAPGGHAGGVAYGPAPDDGDCSGDGENDFSSRDSIIGPEVVLPAGATSPRLTFGHYVATEAGWDGGNVKYSLNGAEFEVVPAPAYIFNGPDQLAPLAAGNTNPLAGEEAFTGTDGGKVVGSWGQSQVNLAALGAGAGDTIQLRFDIGRDGCGGRDGWYVDNITISTCKAVSTVIASKTTAKAPKRVPFAQNFEVRVTVVKVSGGPANGLVKILKGEKTLARGRLRPNGTVTLTVKKNLGKGKQTLVASYAGTKTIKPSKDRFTVRIVR